MVERKKSKKQSAKPKREPNTSQLFNKVNTISESTKALSREIKGMAKIFKDNQKVLVSMSDMMQSLNLAMSQMQKQAKQDMNIDTNIQCPRCNHQFANLLTVNDKDIILCTSCFSDNRLISKNNRVDQHLVL